MRHAWVRRVGMVVLVGVMALAGDTYAASVKPPTGVARVVDANNKLVGEVIGNDQSSLNPLVAMNIAVPSIVVGISPNSLLGNKNLYFTGANCSGQAFFGAGEVLPPNITDHMYPFVGVSGSGKVIYGLQPNAGPVAFTNNSLTLAFQSGCISSQGDNTGIVAAPIIDLSTQFTPPYSFVYP